MNIIRKETKGKIKDEDIVHLLRTYKYIDNDNYVKYHSFLILVYMNGVNDNYFSRCLDEFINFLKKECNNDLFIFIVKINNMCNNTSVKKTIEFPKMLEFFKRKTDNNLEKSSLKKFDFDNDGLISMDDLKNVILCYVDKHYFDNQQQINNKQKQNIDLINYNENKKLFKDIKQALNKINMTEDNFFYFLDYNRDNVIDLNEFEKQILKIPLERKYTSKQIKLFYSYLDEYNSGKVDINIFKIKLDIFNKDILINDDNGYKGNSTIENLILEEFSKWYLKNSNLCDTELFSILDYDHDGKISINDMKHFSVNVLLMEKQELNDSKLLHFIEAVSPSNGNKNLLLSDI
jgi:Ca2+-binding EF-hand superfamily protein